MKAFIIIDSDGLFYDIRQTMKQSIELLMDEIDPEEFMIVPNEERTYAEVFRKTEPEVASFYIEQREF